MKEGLPHGFAKPIRLAQYCQIQRSRRNGSTGS
jgi:hypothetical protein